MLSADWSEESFHPVMAGLGPAIHEENPWIPGSSPGMTSFLA